MSAFNSGRPVHQKPAKLTPAEKREGKAHMGKVAQLPCMICETYGMQQNAPTEVHHPKSRRYGSRRTLDKFGLPLCHSHHNKLIPYSGDEDKIGFHNDQAEWERRYGLDYEWSKWVADRIARLD